MMNSFSAGTVSILRIRLLRKPHSLPRLTLHLYGCSLLRSNSTDV
ncbi:hypothetical protein EaACW_pEI700005 (plasmid) [Erwinia amylovora ACW56400]|nr:hypothetical protein EaACW_pEI700005 [Erwinia amylovora ACW56400]